MDKDKHITPLPKGPWLSEEEIQAILHTDADADFDRIMQQHHRSAIGLSSAPRVPGSAHTRWLRLWPIAAAASIAIGTFLAWPEQEKEDTVAYIYGQRIENEQVVMSMVETTLAEALTPCIALEDELNDILAP